MGTRSTVKFYQDEAKKELILSVYQQYDGYIEGVGFNLAKWLKSKTMINGIGSGQTMRQGFANGNFGALFLSRFDDVDWKEATKEDYSEFKELVIRHLKGLGFKDGDSFVSLVDNDVYTINFGGDIDFTFGGFTLGGYFMYYNNKWIQPISAKETEKEKLKTLLNQMKDLLDSM